MSSIIITFIIIFVLSYAWHMMGITIGYHRLLSHRSFRCPKLIEYFWILGGYLAFQGSPIWWITMHRAHHRYTDSTLDPHSPRLSSWRYAYYGWIKEPGYPQHIDPIMQCKDMGKDPLYKWLEQGGNWRKAHKLCFWLAVLFRMALLLCFGWVVALASLSAALVVQQIPLLLNVVCHIPKLGYKNYLTPDGSVNVWWVAILTAGEGWHNNHHAFPGSARSGLRSFEFDPSWLTLRLLKLVGLISWMREESILSKYKPYIRKTVSFIG
jgi:sn-1 stearoyl-lipid 9-desaturase